MPAAPEDEATITSQLLKKKTGENDLEAIQWLHLFSLTIQTITNTPLQLCRNLREINLSHNCISDISGLQSLVNLERIDLGFNKISVISNNSFTSLINLKYLDFTGNLICELKNVTDGLRSSSPTLTHLYLQRDGDGSYSGNSVCSEFSYFKRVISVCEGLKVLDGECLMLRDVADDVVSDSDVSVFIDEGGDDIIEDWYASSKVSRPSFEIEGEVTAQIETITDVIDSINGDLIRAVKVMRGVDDELRRIGM